MSGIETAITQKQAEIYALLAQHGPCTVRQLVNILLADQPNPSKILIAVTRNTTRHKLTRLRGKKIVRLLDTGRWIIWNPESSKRDPTGQSEIDGEPGIDWRSEQQAWLASVEQARIQRQQTGRWQRESR